LVIGCRCAESPTTSHQSRITKRKITIADETTKLDPVAARRNRVLSIVIQEYTRNAQPVGSNTIAQEYDLGVSAATIRNDLAALERDGLLTHPHTSAGRIPTDAGYRYFVHKLLADTELPSTERKLIRSEFSDARRELDQWLRVSTSVLARASHGAAVATPPRAAQSRFKHIELVGIHDTTVLLVLVLEEGAVKQQLLDLDEPMEQADLSRISNELNDRLANATAAEVLPRSQQLTARGAQSLLAAQVAFLIAEIMGRLDNQLGSQIYRDGLAQVLEAPEFAENANARKIVRVLEQRPLLQEILDEYLIGDDVRVVIAGDGRFDELQDISLVISSYGVSNHATGMLGVIGPLRMSYGRSISAVRFVAGVMSDMVGDMYGHPPSLEQNET
jgi:heat-inducible transcriptional repressor